MGIRSFVTTWHASRSYGRVLRLRKQGRTEDALTVACDGLTRVLNSGARATPPLLTWALGLGDLSRGLAQELGRPNAVTTQLRQMIDYWEHAIRTEPNLGEFQPAKDYIASFRAHLKALDAASQSHDLK